MPGFTCSRRTSRGAACAGWCWRKARGADGQFHAGRFMTAPEVIAALRLKFSPPEWAFLEQCGNGTGAHCHRWADAVAMNLWPSLGLEIKGVMFHGEQWAADFPVDRSRGRCDWLPTMTSTIKR